MTFKITTIAAVAALGFATPALADDDKSAFEGGDYDAFSENYDRTERFKRIDTDEDGMISRDEQKEYEFAHYDRNRDGNLDEEESDLLNEEYESDDEDWDRN